MKNSSTNHEKFLLRIERRFAKFREKNDSQRIRYPDQLKALMRSGASIGIPSGRLAKSAGVAVQSVAVWLGDSSAEPRELFVEDAMPTPMNDFKSTPDVARIILRSGVVVELATGALTPHLVLALNGGGSQ